MEKRKIMIAAFSVAALNIIFPPWQIQFKQRVADMGYWWITNPPQRTTSLGTVFDSEINIIRLLLQLAALALVSGSVYLAVGKK